MSRSIRTLIIDDEPALVKDIQLLLSAHPQFVDIGSCGSIADAHVLIKATKPDLILLDIALSDGTCFELLELLEHISFHIIFITAHHDKAINAIKVGALDYLVKPISREEFTEALAKAAVQPAVATLYDMQLGLAKDFLKPSGIQSRIALKTKNYIDLVAYDEILYCRSDGAYTTFYLTGDRKILASRSIKEYEAMLDPHTFFRTHQSYIVNNSFIRRYHKDGYLILQTGIEIPVSSRKREAILKLLTSE